MSEESDFLVDFETRSGKRFQVRQLIASDVTLLHARNVFQNEGISIDDMVFETIITHPEYGQRMILALVDGQIAAKVRIGLEQSDIEPRYIGKLGFLRDLTVLPQLRNDGIGHALIQFAEAVVRKEGRQFSGVRITPERTRLVKFFLRRGYGEMFMEFPDAFDLYKDLSVVTAPWSETELLLESRSVLERARFLTDAQGC